MLFNSFSFAIFFPIVTALFFLLPQRWRWAMLLAASCYFYMAFIPVYIFILFFTIAIDYTAGLLIENATSLRRRKLFLVGSILANVGVLAVFKYFNFLNANCAALAHFMDWNYPIKSLGLILPIGLSFHTFQSLSYTIEVYRGNQKAEHHLGIFALYVMFYPQLVAGPIERPQNLLHQFREHYVFDYQRVTDGLKLIAWGLFKKVVIADRLAIYVDTVYNHPAAYSGWPVILATYFFAFQIYCDFSGYSDIAIGAAQVMGFHLMDNFNRPYFAKSIGEFWKRWHISLSTWFRDYLYIPLGGNRVAGWRVYLNLLIVFLVSGLWHGANWTFVIWGGLHGFYLMFGRVTAVWRARFNQGVGLATRPALHRWVQVLITFHLVLFAWVFFRAHSFTDACVLFSRMTRIDWSTLNPVTILRFQCAPVALGTTELLVAFAAIAFMEGLHLMQRHNRIRHMLQSRPTWQRWTVYYAIGLGFIFFGVFTKTQFIYFQF